MYCFYKRLVHDPRGVWSTKLPFYHFMLLEWPEEVAFIFQVCRIEYSEGFLVSYVYHTPSTLFYTALSLSSCSVVLLEMPSANNLGCFSRPSPRIQEDLIAKDEIAFNLATSRCGYQCLVKIEYGEMLNFFTIKLWSRLIFTLSGMIKEGLRLGKFRGKQPLC